MSQRMHGMVRAAVHDLAAESRPIYFDPRAIAAKGRRMRRRRGARIAASLGALVALAVMVPNLLLAPSETLLGSAPNETTATPPGLAALPGGLIVGAVTRLRTNDTESLVWSRDERRFKSFPYYEVIPAPVGSLASVFDEKEQRYGLLDVTTEQVRWLDNVSRLSVESMPTWSPDGRYLAVLDSPKGGDFTVAIVDSRDGSVRKLLDMDWLQYYCAAFCHIGWHDQDTLTLPFGRNVSEALAPTYSAMRQISTKDGHRESTQEMPGAYAAPDDWSTDGRYVTLVSADGIKDTQPRYTVYDTIDHKTISEAVSPLDTWWISANQRLEVVENSVRLVALDGSVLGTYPLPAPGQVILVQG